MDNFSKILHNINITADIVINRIPESEIQSIFHFHPSIKNIYGMNRLSHYMHVCKTIRDMDIKSVLVVQRVLQGIGECMPSTEKEDFSFKRFLSLCLPREIAKIFRRLRNELTHLKGHAFPSKIECEKMLLYLDPF